MYEIAFHPKVKKDIQKLDGATLKKIRRILKEKVAYAPEQYGKPLSHTLKYFRSLRVGPYRVIYTIQDKKLIVLVLIIGKRDAVYEEALKRLGE